MFWMSRPMGNSKLDKLTLICWSALVGLIYFALWSDSTRYGKLIMASVTAAVVVAWWLVFTRPVRDEWRYAEGSMAAIEDHLPSVSTSTSSALMPVLPAGGKYIYYIRVKPVTLGRFKRSMKTWSEK